MSAAIESLRTLPELTGQTKLRNACLLGLKLPAPTPLLSPSSGGVIAMSMGYTSVFQITLFCLACGGLLLLLGVREPRAT